MNFDIGTLPSASQELSSVLYLLPLRPSGTNDPSFLPHRDPPQPFLCPSQAGPSNRRPLRPSKALQPPTPLQGQPVGFLSEAALTAFLDIQSRLAGLGQTGSARRHTNLPDTGIFLWVTNSAAPCSYFASFDESFHSFACFSECGEIERCTMFFKMSIFATNVCSTLFFNSEKVGTK